MKIFRLALLATLVVCPIRAAKHVVLISIDGFAAYHLTNQALELPNIRKLAHEGVWAASSETVFPSVTHPSHTTMLTGVEPRIHGVLSNGMTNRKTEETFHPTNKRRIEIVKVPTLFDAAKKKGLATAALFWPETREDRSVDFNVPEVLTDSKAEISALPADTRRELQQAGVPIDLYYRWFGVEMQGAADMILTEAAAYALRTYKPGLTAIHLLTTDKRQHAYGPHHYLAQEALTQADACVGRLRKAVEEAGLADETVFLVVADHGFHSVYEELTVRPAFASLGDKVRLNAYGWTLWIELTEKFEAGRDSRALESVLAELAKHPRIARVVRPDDLHALGQPRFEEDDHAMGHYAVIADIDTHLSLDGAATKVEVRAKKTPSHGHGYPPGHPRMYTSLVLAGAGVRKGVTIGHVSNLDIAPTIARLLDLEMPAMSGRALEEALTQ